MVLRVRYVEANVPKREALAVVFCELSKGVAA